MRLSRICFLSASLSPILDIFTSANGFQLLGNDALSETSINNRTCDSSRPLRRSQAVALHVVPDPISETIATVAHNTPAGHDGKLTWETAIGKGRNLVRLLESSELALCDVTQSNFTDWTALVENGWSKTYQGKPKESTGWKFALEKLKLSSDDQKNTQYDLVQSENVTVDGKSYRSSGGSYSNVMNTDGGIFALNALSPQVEGIVKAPPLDGSPGNEIVPLQSWADVTFLEWSNACKGSEDCMKGLKTIVKCHAQSNVTDRIATQALGGKDKWATWPGKSFPKDLQEFAAIIATPSGSGVTWLLLSHRQQLGNKYVDRIDLWSEKDRDSNSTFYAFHLKDHSQGKRSLSLSANSITKATFSTHAGVSEDRPPYRRDAQGNQSSLVYDSSSASLDYNQLFTSDHDYNYEQAQKVGEYLASLMQSSREASCVKQTQWNLSDLSSNGWSNPTGMSGSSKGLERVHKILSHAKLLVDDESPEHVIWKHDTSKTVNGKTYPATNATYDAVYAEHAIILFEASSPVSELSKIGTELLPPLKALSDVLWLHWESRSKSMKTDIKDLRFIMVDQTTNSFTKTMAKHVFGDTDISAYPGKTFEADSKELAAILASPHGQGVVWLLSHNKAKLGSKTVESVQICADEQPCLLFTISDYSSSNSSQRSEESTAGRPNSVHIRQNGIAPRADDWDEAASKGKTYLDMLKCGAGQPSAFTSYEDLKTWGWIVDFNQHLSRELDEPQKQSIEYLGASYVAEETWEVMNSHEVSTTHDETTYPPTEATFENIYAPEIIISVNNLAPRKASEDQSFEGPFPQLEKQSDVIFLEYQRLMVSMKKPLTGLRGILRSNVINKETEKIVARALGTVPSSPRRWPAWPGRDFDAGSDEGAAIIASPSGRAPVWLLGTHKVRLGHKSISKIRVFGRSSTLYMLFVFEEIDDGNCGTEDSGVTVAARSPELNTNIMVSQTGIAARAVSWNEAISKGKQYLDMLQCGSAPQSEFMSYNDLKKCGWEQTKNEPASSFDDAYIDALEHLQVSSMSTDVWQIDEEHTKAKILEDKMHFPTNAFYFNVYSPEFIIFANNWGPRAKGPQQKPSVDGVKNPFPPLERLSDVTFLEFRQLMKGLEEPMTRLKGSVQSNIVNKETVDLAAEAMRVEVYNWPDWPGRDFYPDSEGFAALLASPNGRGNVWFLAQHKDDLGHKSISKIRVYGYYGQLYMLFVYEDVVAADDGVNANQRIRSIEERTSSISIRGEGDQLTSLLQFPPRTRPVVQLDWDKWVTKGYAYLDMLRCGSGTQSRWKSYDDLAKFGWKRVRESDSVDIYGKAGYQKAMDYLGVSSKPSDQRNAAQQHLNKVTVNGKTYWPTGGIYDNKYNMELISADFNYGPRYKGPRQFPPVTGDPNPFPNLEKFSDVVYLEFARLMKQDNKPMNKLKGVLRAHVVNAETKAIVAKATGLSTNTLRDESLDWPGRDFQADSDELAALIASPNGRGVVWFLASHEELGHKSISSVRVYNDAGLWILFVLKDLSAQSVEKRSVGNRHKSNGKQTKAAGNGSTSAPSDSISHSNRRDLATRAPLLEPDKYQRFVDKGKKLVSALQSESECFAQSEFTEYTAMKDWGWSRRLDTKSAPTKTERRGAWEEVFDLVDNSWDHDMNRYVDVTHNKKVEHSGTTYYPTRAGYSNRFSPSLIVAMNNHGPASKGWEQDPPVTGDPNPYPDLARLSDVLFLEYQRVMAEMKHPMQKLKAIWRHHVINLDTRAIAYHIDGNGATSLDDMPGWPGKDFAADSDELAALIASPNGVAVAYFLLQHREQLGAKTVTGAKVWVDLFKLHILFLVGDSPKTQESSGISSKGARDVESRIVSGKFVGVSPKDLMRRGLGDDQYNEMVEKGKNLVSALESEKSCVVQSDWTDDKALATWGWYSSRKPKVGPVSFFTATKQVYEFVGASMDNSMNHRAYDSHADKKEIDGVTYYPTAAEFDNRYNPTMIIAENIYGADYQGKTQEPPVTGDPNPFPKLRFWSDVTFLEYQKFMRELWHRAIINPITRDLAARLLEKDDWVDIPDWPGKDFTSDSKEFSALIGSDNGKGIVFLLLQHRKQLGSKTITKARVWKDHTLHILYIIEDACAKGDVSSNDAPDRRLDRRVDEPDSKIVSDARDAGRFLVMAQESSTEILESCMSMKQSEFTEIAQLEKSGWTSTGDHSQALDEESDEATFNSWLDMNLDLTANGNREIEYQHNDETTDADGVVYHPTRAFYKNIFNEGAIAALNNASPWKNGKLVSPPVDGSKNTPFPPLKQWSDAVFLIYKDICNSDPAKMKKLKGVLRPNVINANAREALYEYMGKHGELENGIPKTWPGTEYKLDDDGFNVALGVPNGKGVGYLLATHRESLGWKEIYMIRVFSVQWYSAYNILYYIRDHKENAKRSEMHLSSPTAATNPTVLYKIARSENKTSTKDLATLNPRVPNDEAYEKARKKGSMLACQLYDPASAVTQSTWTDPKSLESYGWQELEQDYRWEYNHPDNDIGPALKELGVSVDGLSNVKHKWWHTTESEVDGSVYMPTYGWYTNVFNVDGGVIVAESNFGPDSQKNWEVDNDEEKTIPLKQWSDVVFLGWQKYAGGKVKNLKYVFRHNIYNKQTRELLYSIMDKRGDRIKVWPGTKISMIEGDAQAILGSPNGHGVAYLLLQHKQQLGVKVIDYVTVFRSDDGKDISLCFWIVNEDDDGTVTQLPSDLRPPALGERSVQIATNLSHLPSRSEEFFNGTLTTQLSHSSQVSWVKALGKRFSKMVQSCRGIMQML